jgi:hypothetical protein
MSKMNTYVHHSQLKLLYFQAIASRTNRPEAEHGVHVPARVQLYIHRCDTSILSLRYSIKIFPIFHSQVQNQITSRQYSVVTANIILSVKYFLAVFDVTP